MGRNINFLLAAVVFFVTLVGFVAFQYFNSRNTTLPDGLSTNGPTLDAEAARLVGRHFTFPSVPAERVEPILYVYLEKSCNACKSEIKRISAMEFPNGAPVIGIMQEDLGTIDAYRKSNGIGFKVLQDTEGKVAEELSIRYFPADLLVKDGVMKKPLRAALQPIGRLLSFFKANEVIK
ncbi:MAG: AhpC/TSA family protein [Acidobacteria bacterium OLB17]|nr:MAG: AhpC/TSA family protein [Acidobacteria bacterium OLB17]MCZ2391469.1 peroxiredoxin family protein [Acidobacteriota bacterium]